MIMYVVTCRSCCISFCQAEFGFLRRVLMLQDHQNLSDFSTVLLSASKLSGCSELGGKGELLSGWEAHRSGRAW